MFAKFHKNFNDAIENIRQHLIKVPEDYDYPMVGLVRWMLETDANPYSYLPHHWAGCVGSAEMFDGLLHTIHHALYGDGDITFVTVNGEPRIVFAWRHEDNFRDYVLSDTEKDFEKRWGGDRYEIKVLDITPDQFGPLYDQYQKEWLKECFLTDSVRGIEWAAENYRKYKCWDESWIDEAKKEHGDE